MHVALLLTIGKSTYMRHHYACSIEELVLPDSSSQLLEHFDEMILRHC